MKNILSIILGISLLLFGCESTRLVSAERLSKKSGTDFNTFGFADISKKVKVNRVDTEKTRAFLATAIIEIMKEKGYEFSDTDPDLLVDMELNYIKNRSQSSSSNNNYSPYYSRTNRYYGGRYNYRDFQDERFARESNVTARIELLFADSSADTKLWKGAVETRFVGKIDKRILRLEEAIEKLILGFEERTEK